MTTRATNVYLNWGRWVVDCACGSAQGVQPGQTSTRCAVEVDGVAVVDDGTCGAVIDLEWPDVEAVEASVAGLPPARQSWRPEDDQS